MTLTGEARNEMIKHHISKSERALESALLLSEQGDCNGAANRAYYCIFYAENALLLTKGISGDSHKHIHRFLSKEFVKEGLLPIDTNQKIETIQVIRNIADYSETRSVTKEELEKSISQAKEFLVLAKKIVDEEQNP